MKSVGTSVNWLGQSASGGLLLTLTWTVRLIVLYVAKLLSNRSDVWSAGSCILFIVIKNLGPYT